MRKFLIVPAILTICAASTPSLFAADTDRQEAIEKATPKEFVGPFSALKEVVIRDAKHRCNNAEVKVEYGIDSNSAKIMGWISKWKAAGAPAGVDLAKQAEQADKHRAALNGWIKKQGIKCSETEVVYGKDLALFRDLIRVRFDIH